MPYPIEEKLVVAVASSALFDLSESDAVYCNEGLAAYRAHQREREDVVLNYGVAFPFVRRLLSLNHPDRHDEPVEVILLSQNDPDTGLRVMNSIEHHKLPISRAAFVRGEDPFRYVKAFNACLFLSANEENVRRAVANGLPAGRVMAASYIDDPHDGELRIAFDFDGVVVDDEAEKVFQLDGLEAFQDSEVAKALEAHNPGPLGRLFQEIGRIHQREVEHEAADPGYKSAVRVAIVTSRNAPAHKRVVTTLRTWGIEIDETFFLGGMDKGRVLSEFRPHLFFDDQLTHAGPAAGIVPSVHVPFGVVNQPGEDASAQQAHRADAVS